MYDPGKDIDQQPSSVLAIEQSISAFGQLQKSTVAANVILFISFLSGIDE
jgi:hypothetical protein